MATPQTAKTFTDDALSTEVANAQDAASDAEAEAGRSHSAADRVEASEDDAYKHAQSTSEFTSLVSAQTFDKGARGWSEDAQAAAQQAQQNAANGTVSNASFAAFLLGQTPATDLDSILVERNGALERLRNISVISGRIDVGRGIDGFRMVPDDPDAAAANSIARDYMLATGADTYLEPDREYYVSSTLDISEARENVLYGNGRSSVMRSSQVLTNGLVRIPSPGVGVDAVAIRVADLILQGTGTVQSADTLGVLPERCLYAAPGSALSVEGLTLRDATILMQVDGAVAAKIRRMRFENAIPRLVDGSGDRHQGYSLLISNDAEGVDVYGVEFFDGGRHAIYISSGAHRGRIRHFLIDGTLGNALQMYATSTQNAVRDWVIEDGNIMNVGNCAGASQGRGLTAVQQVRDAAFRRIRIVETESYGVGLEGSTTGALTRPQDIDLEDVRGERTGSHTFWFYGADDVRARRVRSVDSEQMGMLISHPPGGGQADGVSVEEYECTGAATYGLTATGDAVDNLHLGRHTISGSGTADLNVTADVASRMTLDLPTYKLDFEATAVANGDGSLVLTIPGSALTKYTFPFPTEAIAMSVRGNGGPNAGTATFMIRNDGANWSALQVQLGVSEFQKDGHAAYGSSGALRFTAGEDIEVGLVTAGGYLSASPRSYKVTLIVARKPG